MGRILLICRLAARDLRRRRAEAVLMVIVITAATATLTLGLVLHGATSNPYLDTKAVTAGPDVGSPARAARRKTSGPPASLTALDAPPASPATADPIRWPPGAASLRPHRLHRRGWLYRRRA